MLIDVRVPAGIELAEFVPDHRDELASGFNQSASLERTLAEEGHAIARTEFLRFAVEIERNANLRRIHQRERQRTVFSQSAATSGRVRFMGEPTGSARARLICASSRVKLLKKRPPAIEPVERHAVGQRGPRSQFESALR